MKKIDTCFNWLSRLTISKMSSNSFPVVFLDVDGVLNYSGLATEFSEECLFRIATVVHSTNSKIIVSSTYRLDESSMMRLWAALAVYGISRVNYSHPCASTPDLMDYDKTRTDEIMFIVNKLNLTNWVALDDGDLLTMGDIANKSGMQGHFVKTDPKLGISDTDVLKATELLNK